MFYVALVVETSKQETSSCYGYTVTSHCLFGTLVICSMQSYQIIMIKVFFFCIEIAYNMTRNRKHRIDVSLLQPCKDLRTHMDVGWKLIIEK